MSPQVAERLKYTNKTDIWSTGVVFIAMINLQNPFLKLEGFQQLDPAIIKISDERLEPLRQLICLRMVVADEDKRANVDEVIASAIFSSQFEIVSKKAKSWLLGDRNSNQQVETVEEPVANQDEVGDRLGEELSAKLCVSTGQVDSENQVN